MASNIKLKNINDKYKVSSDGKVYRVKKNGELKERVCTVSSNRYKTVVMSNCGAISGSTVHRLVAEAFLPNPNNLPCVNHIDGNKLNNNVDNLEWCTYKENSEHAIDSGVSFARKNQKKATVKANQSRAIMTAEEASDMLEMKETLKMSCKEIAELIGVGVSAIYDINNGTKQYYKVA